MRQIQVPSRDAAAAKVAASNAPSIESKVAPPVEDGKLIEKATQKNKLDAAAGGGKKAKKENDTNKGKCKVITNTKMYQRNIYIVSQK